MEIVLCTLRNYDYCEFEIPNIGADTGTQYLWLKGDFVLGKEYMLTISELPQPEGEGK